MNQLTAVTFLTEAHEAEAPRIRRIVGQNGDFRADPKRSASTNAPARQRTEFITRDAYPNLRGWRFCG